MLIRIGTRESPLAVRQAERMAELMQMLGLSTELHFIHSEGDLDLTKPLYEMGIQGVFTRALDAALLEGKIDLAVHSAKDVPTKLAGGTILAAVLKRDNPLDVIVCRDNEAVAKVAGNEPMNVATGSIRRKAQWLAKHPGSKVDNIRGNVGTRLEKLSASGWEGALFAAAGLERLNIDASMGNRIVRLDWMLPAPAQGAIVATCRQDDENIIRYCNMLNDEASSICIQLERQLLQQLGAGCSTPVAALATHLQGVVRLQANITAPDGSDCIQFDDSAPAAEGSRLAKEAALQMIKAGANKWLAHA